MRRTKFKGVLVQADRVLKRIFGPKREEEWGGWRRLNNVELHNSDGSSNIIRVIISGKMGWTRH
jgi:hypothetical protein